MRWKGATITPLPKVKVVSELGELRPLSLTADLGLVLESFVVEPIMEDIRPSIDPHQYGNLKGRSTAHYLIWILDELLKATDESKTFGSLTLVDFRKAFDYVNHTVVITELLAMGCRSSIVPFLCSFLNGRRHKVRYCGTLSDFACTTSGVPQGTKLGPVMFLALVNNVCRDVETRAKFVDDLIMLHIFRISIHDLVPVHYPQQRDLNKLSSECKDRGMETNAGKSEVLYPLLPKNRPIVLPDLQLCGEPLPVVQQVKLLGVHLNNTLTWSCHVDYIIKKASKSIFILIRARRFRFSHHTMCTLYIWYIRTTLEYAAQVWHSGLTQEQHDSLERIQKRCLRIILGTQYGNYRTALEALSMQSLHDRREQLTLRFARSLLRSREHRHLLPRTLRDGHGRATRHGNLLVPVRCKTERYRRSAIPYMVRLLNSNM